MLGKFSTVSPYRTPAQPCGLTTPDSSALNKPLYGIIDSLLKLIFGLVVMVFKFYFFALIVFLVLTASMISSSDPAILQLPTSREGDKSPVSSLTLTERLGPLVVAKDGTTSRIANWREMTPEEKRTTLRRITARNRERLEALQTKMKDDL